jgi:hypothetical protein
MGLVGEQSLLSLVLLLAVVKVPPRLEVVTTQPNPYQLTARRLEGLSLFPSKLHICSNSNNNNNDDETKHNNSNNNNNQNDANKQIGRRQSGSIENIRSPDHSALG